MVNKDSILAKRLGDASARLGLSVVDHTTFGLATGLYEFVVAVCGTSMATRQERAVEIFDNIKTTRTLLPKRF